MAFKRVGSNIKIQFGEDHELHGLEIESRRVKMRELTDITSLAGAPSATMTDQIGRASKLCEKFAEVLLAWNLEDEEGAVPCTYEGLMEQDIQFVLQVVKAWIDAVSGVPAPLQRPSGDGEPSPVASLPMDNE